MISTASLSERLAGLEGIGVTEHGIQRLAWTEEDAACRAWFEDQARAAGLATERDPAGNLWACPATGPPWWAVGSHLDSVRGGGRFDGPLGVACAFEIAACSEAPLAVISFADEEGARFNTPTFGSKALTGRLQLPDVLDRRDDRGVRLADAMRAAGVDPAGLDRATEWLARLRGFLEIHIDQSTAVAAAGVPLSVVSALSDRCRLEFEFHGRADHAGTTVRADRRDALAAAARLIVAAAELDAGTEGLTVTASRMLIEPNAATTIAERVRLWVDIRSGESAAIEAALDALTGAEQEAAAGARVEVGHEVASRSVGRQFDPELRAGLALAAAGVVGAEVPEQICFAGHDAGIVAERVPAAMLLVRNRSGVSHAPAEAVSLEDAAVAAEVVAGALRALSAGA